MSEYQKIQQQIAELQRQADSLWITERTAAIETISGLIKTFDLKPSDLGFAAASDNSSRRRPRIQQKKIPIKYQDNAGNTWTGRGLQPGWLKAAIAAGASLDSFKVNSP